MGKLQGADHKTVAELGNDKSLLQPTSKIYDPDKDKTLQESLADGDWDTNTDTLATLTDTNFTSLADGELIKYDNGSGKWINFSLGTVSIGSFSDVDLTGVTDNSILKWDQGDGKFIIGEDNEGASGGSGAGRENYVINTTFDADISDVTSNSIPLVISQETVAPLRGLGSLKVVATSPVAGDSVDIALNGFEDTDLHSILEANFDYTYNGPENAVEIILVNTVGPDKIHSSLGFLKAGPYRNFKAFYQTHPTIKTWALRIVDNVGGTDWDLLVDKPVLTPEVSGAGSGSEIVFKAHLGSNQNTPSTGASIVPLDVSTIDSNGCFDLAKNAFKAKETGYYFASGFVAMAALSAGTFFQAEIRIGGVVKLRGNRNEPSVPASRSLASGLLYVEKDQLVELYLDQNESASETIQGGEVNTQLSLFKIGGSGSTSLGGEILSEIDYRGNAGQSITAAVTDISFATPFNIDKLGEWDGNGFVAKSTKTYIFSGLALFTTALNADLNSYIGGVFDRTVNTAHGIAEQGKNFICIVKLQAGERWSLRSGASGTLSNNNNVHYINVNALAETSNGIAPEQVKKGELKTYSGQFTGTGAFLTFNNLVIGRTYTIEGVVTYRNNAASSTNCEVQIENGTADICGLRNRDDVSSALNTDAFSRTFIATNSTLTLSKISGSTTTEIYGEGNLRYTHALLKEKNSLTLGSFF